MNQNALNTNNNTEPHNNTMAINDCDNIYFLGIGGIGMSALALYFKNLAKSVSGYDKAPSNITAKLQANGIDVNFIDSIANSRVADLSPVDTLIVYTPAIPADNVQLNYFKSNGFRVQKRSKVLGEITQSTTCFAVAGTHGKTTTSSVLGHLLFECNVKLTAFLGGISKNYDSNFIYSGSDVSVVEADEFDRSFLTLSPDFACITSMDPDHLDIYGAKEQLEESFIEFSKCLKPQGKLFIKSGLPLKGITYGIEDQSDYCATDVCIKDGAYHFSLRTPNKTIKNFQFNLPGRHNLLNATIALAMSLEYGCPSKKLAEALASFHGVDRRFNYHIKKEGLIFIDDYAHHPTEIKAVHSAVSEMYPGRNTLVVFQPHLFSRTRDFADDFGNELSRFNSIILLEIYPAREEPMNGVNSEWLMSKISNPNKVLVSKTDLLNEIKKQEFDIVITLGAGDIGAEVNKIKEGLLR